MTIGLATYLLGYSAVVLALTVITVVVVALLLYLAIDVLVIRRLERRVGK